VTGGSGAIGAAICRRLAHAGHHVYVHAHRNVEVAESLIREILAAGGSAQLLCFDSRDAVAVSLALKSAINDGPIQILINNAGIHDDAAFPGMSADQWHRVIDTSVDGFFNVTQPLTLDEREGIRRRIDRAARSHEARRAAGRGGQPRGLPCIGRGRIRDGTDHIHQRWNDMNLVT
jgi:NAD(P)-dependent dehydrogenase (short-subunit alcohol dehydrogenase family)